MSTHSFGFGSTLSDSVITIRQKIAQWIRTDRRKQDVNNDISNVTREDNEIMEVERELFLSDGKNISTSINDENHNKEKTIELLEFELDSVFVEKTHKKARKHSALLTFIDVTLVTTIVLVNVVGTWRGMFQLILVSCELHHLYVVCLIGSLLHVQFAMTRDFYERYFEKRSWFRLFMRIIYTYAFGVACLFQWAGLWYILDEVLGYGVAITVATTVLSTILLVCLKVLRNVLAPPFTISVDIPEYMFQFKTFFRKDITGKVSHVSWFPKVKKL